MAGVFPAPTVPCPDRFDECWIGLLNLNCYWPETDPDSCSCEPNILWIWCVPSRRVHRALPCPFFPCSFCKIRSVWRPVFRPAVSFPAVFDLPLERPAPHPSRGVGHSYLKARREGAVVCSSIVC